MTRKTVLIIVGVNIAILAALIYYFTTDHKNEPSVEPESVVYSQDIAVAPEPEPTVVEAPQSATPKVPEKEVEELRFLPGSVSLAERDSSKMLSDSPLAEGNRRLSGVRAITTAAENGDFLNPRISPDGLQVLVTRPGYEGVYVVSIHGGEPIKIAEGNAARARWTPEGRIAVPDGYGNERIYGTDGTLLETRPAEKTEDRALVRDDAIYVADGEGGMRPLTGSDDRYFNPVISPDGSKVVYTGLHSGLYVAPVDGSEEPTYLGPGTNAQWSPDGSGLLYDVTQDDGHSLMEGDIYFVDSDLRSRSNLTEGDSLIGQLPSMGPDGETVVFESEGSIYLGSMQ